MAGGNWTLQDKIRPGAYLRFKNQSGGTIGLGGSGVVTIAVELDWGPQGILQELTAEEMISSNILAKLGHYSWENAVLPLYEALKNCEKVLYYRVNSGGTAAAALLGTLTVTAKYHGSRGNDLAVGITSATGGFEVATYLDGELVECQTVSASGTPQDNDWVSFQLSNTLSAAAVTALTGGSNGIATAENYGAYLTAVKGKDWQVMALPTDNSDVLPTVKTYIQDLRENSGKKVQAVVYDYCADYEGIITVKQGYVRDGVTIAPKDFTAWVAGVTAGAETAQSNTYRIVDGADEIIGEMDSAAIEFGLTQGYFLLSRRTDGTIVVEQDINTLISSATELRKNRMLRTLDRIANEVAHRFETGYLGKIDNDGAGRDLFKQELVTYLESLAAAGALERFDDESDITVSRGTSADTVTVILAVQPVDAMEKLYMTVEVQ
ncbi:MAG: phage tail sheath family protein [Bacillota bacterium]|nr:phage tail sheath family protein [Bacillota bacterium]